MKPFALLAPFLLALLPLTGCVSSKYKLAARDAPAAVALALESAPASVTGPAAPAIGATVTAVIVYRGPGSWKRDAYWDEYVLTVSNRSETPLVVESAMLTDLRGHAVAAGDKPWELEKQSRTYEERFASTTGEVLKLGGGAAGTTAAGMLGGAAIGAMIGNGVAAGAWAIGPPMWVAGAAVAGMVAVPVYAGATIYRNVSSKRAIEAEFQRRRLALPVSLAPMKEAGGSLFFRVSPGPQRLTLQCRAGADTHEVSIDLAPLAALHLRPSVKTAATAKLGEATQTPTPRP